MYVALLNGVKVRVKDIYIACDKGDINYQIIRIGDS